jgi:threonine dehydrogenase-like Zn-dependent dehydrogenase
MREVAMTGRGEFLIREVPDPVMKGPGAIVRTMCSVIGTGTETQGLKALRAKPGDPNKVTGRAYQSMGVVEELSPGLTGYAVGDLVACCGNARHAEKTWVSKNLMAKVPAGVSPEAAAACNCALTGLHALRRGRVQLGDVVFVQGLGLVGQFTAQAAQAAGAVVVASDLVPMRIQKARDCGIDCVLDANAEDVPARVKDLSDGHGADCTICCASAVGSTRPAEEAFEATRVNGRVVIVGVFDFVRPPGSDMDVLMSGGRGPGWHEAWHEVAGQDFSPWHTFWPERRNLVLYLHLVARSVILADPLITHTFPFERAPEAYELALSAPGEALGIALRYGPA